MFSLSSLATNPRFCWIWVTSLLTPQGTVLSSLTRLPPVPQSTRMRWLCGARGAPHSPAQSRYWLAINGPTSHSPSSLCVPAMGSFSPVVPHLTVSVPAVLCPQPASFLLDASLPYLLFSPSSKPTKSVSSRSAGGPCLHSPYFNF